MFALSDTDLNKTILGCGDGPASFNAEMTDLDILLCLLIPFINFLLSKSNSEFETYEPLISQVKQNANRYIWRELPGMLRNLAVFCAMGTFVLDYETGKAAGRYLQVLPSLDLLEEQFDSCVCSHLLFYIPTTIASIFILPLFLNS